MGVFLWQKEGEQFMALSHEISRRSFIKFLTIGSVSAPHVLRSQINRLSPSVTRTTAKATEQPVSAHVVKRISGYDETLRNVIGRSDVQEVLALGYTSPERLAKLPDITRHAIVEGRKAIVIYTNGTIGKINRLVPAR